MKTILKTVEFVHIPEHSWYNHNYYRNTKTGKIILEIGDDDHGADFYWVDSEEDMIAGRHGEYIGFCWMEDFDIPNQYAREHGVADEYEYEFDSELT